MLLMLLTSLAQAGDLKLTLDAPEMGPVTIELQDVASCAVSTASFTTEKGAVWHLRATPSSPEKGQTMVSMELTYAFEGSVQTSRPAMLLRDGEPGEISMGLPDRTVYTIKVLAYDFTACGGSSPL
jgi:hypothetical protein